MVLDRSAKVIDVSSELVGSHGELGTDNGWNWWKGVGDLGAKSRGTLLMDFSTGISY